MSVLSTEVMIHIGGYIALNLVKSVCGCGLVGYGVTCLQQASFSHSSSSYWAKKLLVENDRRKNDNRRRRRGQRSNNNDSSNTDDDDDPDDPVDPDDDGDDHDDLADQQQQQQQQQQNYAYVVDYVVGSMIIGFGLFLVVPSLLSEGFIESAGCVATTSTVVSDTTSNNILSYVKSWTSSPLKDFEYVWKGRGGGGGGGVAGTGGASSSTGPTNVAGGGVANLLGGETSASSKTPKINLLPAIDRVINKSGQ